MLCSLLKKNVLSSSLRMATQTTSAQCSSQLTKCSHQTSTTKQQAKDAQPIENEQLQPVSPIGYIKSCFKSKNGTPRQPSVCTFSRAKLQVLKSVFVHPDHSLQGLEDYSHVWILFLFHKNGPASFTKAKVKPPRLNGAKVGVFATRSPHRPNPVGLTLAKLDKVQGGTLFLSGVDIIEGTPVLDIKPYVPAYDNPLNVLRAQKKLSLEQQGSDSIQTDQTDVCDDKDLNQQCDESTEQNIYNSESPGQCDISEHQGGTDLNTDQDQSDVSSHSGPEKVTQPNSIAPSNKHDNVKNVSATHKSCGNVDDSSNGSKTISSRQSENDKRSISNLEKPSSQDNQQESSITDHSGQQTVPSSAVTSDQAVLGDIDDQKPVPDDKEALSDTVEVKVQPTDVKAVLSNFDEQKHVPDKTETLTDTAEVKVADWIATPPISRLQVELTEKAEKQLSVFHPLQDTDTDSDDYTMDFFKDIQEAKKAICEILEADPRSTYRREKCSDRLYYFAVDTIHVTCWFYDNVAEVIRIQPLCQADIPIS